MIKRTLYFGNLSYLKTTNEQMVIEVQDTGETKTVPIEDIRIVILDHQQITFMQSLLAKLLANKTAVTTCSTHLSGFKNLAGVTVNWQISSFLFSKK